MKTDLYHHNIAVIEGKILSKNNRLHSLRLRQRYMEIMEKEKELIEAVKLEIQAINEEISRLEARRVLFTL